MTPGLSSFPQLPLGIRARALQRKEPQCSVLWRPGAAACSNQLKPRGEIYAGMPGCPMDPEGREYSWPGTRNWEVRRWGACAFSLGLLGSLLTCLRRPALCLRAHMGERGHPTPVLKNSSVCPASKLLCALVPVPRREAGWPSQARCPPLVPAVRGQGWGWGGHGIAGSKQGTERAYGQVSHLLAIW